jgi:hypothetical protein
MLGCWLRHRFVVAEESLHLRCNLLPGKRQRRGWRCQGFLLVKLGVTGHCLPDQSSHQSIGAHLSILESVRLAKARLSPRCVLRHSVSPSVSLVAAILSARRGKKFKIVSGWGTLNDKDTDLMAIYGSDPLSLDDPALLHEKRLGLNGFGTLSEFLVRRAFSG